VDDSFFRALFPGRFRVLGRWLPPLSHWHLACLHALGSPFITGAEITLADIQLGVKIARTRWPAEPDLRATFRDFRERVLRERNHVFVQREADAFAAWRAAYELRPRFWDHEDDELPKLLTAPAILIRIAQLDRLTKFTHAEAWNDVPPGYAAWLIATIQEQQGAELRFLYDGDDEDDGLPDLNALSEDDLYAYVVADVGVAEAEAWLARRRDAQAGKEETHGRN
jgi:hypothetical protein